MVGNPRRQIQGRIGWVTPCSCCQSFPRSLGGGFIFIQFSFPDACNTYMQLIPSKFRMESEKWCCLEKESPFLADFPCSMLNLRGSYARGRLHGSAFSGAYQRPSQQALAILWPGGRSLWLLCPPPTFQFINLNFSFYVSEGFLGCIWSRWSMPEILNLSQDLLIMYILYMYINMISRLRACMCKHHSKALQPFCSTWTPFAFEFKPLKLFVLEN